jgi:hypothetical protein
MDDFVFSCVMWGFGIFTGLGLGTSIASHRYQKVMNEWMAEDDMIIVVDPAMGQD